MNKKINILSILPMLGSILLCFYIYYKYSQGKMLKKNFIKTMVLVVFLITIVALILSVYLIKLSPTIQIQFLRNYGDLLLLAVLGYGVNLITFLFVNKRV